MKTLHFALSVPNQKTPRGAGHFLADATDIPPSRPAEPDTDASAELDIAESARPSSAAATATPTDSAAPIPKPSAPAPNQE